MTLYEFCSVFDKYEIVESKTQIDREYYSTTDLIFSDGEVTNNITSEAYIHITSVKDASYLVFIDIEYKIYICIYKYINASKFKYIMQKLQILKKAINKLEDDTHDRVDVDHKPNITPNDVVDINLFTCTECDSKEKLKFVRAKSNPDAIRTKCNKCLTEYKFVPSKYYKLASKKVVCFKSESEASRQIEIAEEVNDNKTTTPTVKDTVKDDKKETK